MGQFVVTPAAGKRLIARAVAAHPAVLEAMRSGTVVIVAGTTNGYVAEELLELIGQRDGFSRHRFFRGITLPPWMKTSETGRLPDERDFPGDVVITRGEWMKGMTLFDVVDDLSEGDLIIKGANAIDLQRRQAAVLIGHPRGGTIVAALQAAVGRRVGLILPVGLEKRLDADLMDLSRRLNAQGSRGLRLLPVPGEIITEVDAIRMLTGAEAEIMAAGGVCGAEGSVWLHVHGEGEEAASELIRSIASEPAFDLCL
ncbi:MAG: hypothetical protein NQU42_06045 [Methanothrix sp.]|uniref:hypothetical protein n=1 Tax=Methanothrix sp. TaxID=90426 RepID=UPI0025FEB5F9|nr:hypothetical protein [Methanothrix sp.]MCQ8903635.1 hypothetical protein [Methanothrix sp.]